MPTPQELRDEARAARALSRRTGSEAQRAWLVAKAEALRRRAQRQEQTAHRPRKPGTPR